MPFYPNCLYNEKLHRLHHEDEVNVNLSVLCVFPDIFRAVLRGGEPLQEPAHLHRVHCGDVPGQETARDAPSHLRHIRGRLPKHAARCSTLSVTSLPLTYPDTKANPCICYQLSWPGTWY